jgi:hypothetical protein
MMAVSFRDQGCGGWSLATLGGLMGSSRATLVALIVCAALLPACGESGAEGALDEAARREPIEGTGLSRITLSADAQTRLDVQTAEVRQAPGQLRLVVPASALIYDSQGAAWVYVEEEPGVYVRHAVAVDRADDVEAVLHDGPPQGKPVVTVGAAELYGVELGVGEDP